MDDDVSAQPVTDDDHDRLPKVCGGDVELANFFEGVDRPGGTGYEASRALLREIPGLPRDTRWTPIPPAYQADTTGTAYATTSAWDGGGAAGYTGGNTLYQADGYNSQDWGRRFLPGNGACVYIDLNHLEVCLPEVLSAYDHVAAWHAMLLIARDAMHRVNARRPNAPRVRVLANNSDGRGQSYGSHMNFLVTRRCFDNLFRYKLHHLIYLASYQASSIVFTGAGKVGSENGQRHVDYQLSQRADFYETLTGTQTTFQRPMINERDEGNVGPSHRQAQGVDQPSQHMARLHVIFFDSTLCHVACLLKVGVTQIVLAMLEQEVLVPEAILDNPLRALRAWSHTPSLRAKARSLSGAKYTAIDVQRAILDKAATFVSAGKADGLVPRAQEIVALWDETLCELEAFRKSPDELPPLAAKLDWALKLSLLQRVMGRRGLAWDAPEVKHLDHLYHSLDHDEGLYWACERAGGVHRVVSPGRVERFVHQPPDDTRAWLRAQLLRRAPDPITDVDWDTIRFRFSEATDSGWPRYTYVSLPTHSPLRFTRRECQSLFEGEPSVQEVLRRLEAEETDYYGRAQMDSAACGTSTGTTSSLAYPPAADDPTVDQRDGDGTDPDGRTPS